MPSDSEIASRLHGVRVRLSPCRLCPRQCGADRLGGATGFCGAGPLATVASAGPHFGEERCLVGRGGSGAIFLAGCNLGCAFCQNDDISRGVAGRQTDAAGLARQMLRLESAGCENINFVTPTHVTGIILEAIIEARAGGMAVPVVWNSSAYESVEVLRLLDGLVEIYMPDFKFSLASSAGRYCNAPDYPARASASILEMHRQVGDLVIESGTARQGLLVRHLVMPAGTAESRDILEFLASVSPTTFVNVMGQYRPAGDVLSGDGRERFGEIARRPTAAEVAEVRDYARTLGLRLDEAA